VINDGSVVIYSPITSRFTVPFRPEIRNMSSLSHVVYKSVF